MGEERGGVGISLPDSVASSLSVRGEPPVNPLTPNDYVDDRRAVASPGMVHQFNGVPCEIYNYFPFLVDFDSVKLEERGFA